MMKTKEELLAMLDSIYLQTEQFADAQFEKINAGIAELKKDCGCKDRREMIKNVISKVLTKGDK